MTSVADAVVILCPANEWRSQPMRREQAERRVAKAEAEGTCSGPHRIVSVADADAERGRR